MMTLISAQNAAPKPQQVKLQTHLIPSDELRDAFYKVGIELERAFNMAARETQAAFKKASENMQQKTSSNYANAQGSVVCTSCGANNVSGSVFCHSCGTKVASTEESSGST